jgi:hypothetical protein
MLTWLKSLSQDNKVKVLIVILGAALAAAGYFGQRWFETTEPASPETKATVTQTTSGNNSPAVSGTKGDVTININRQQSEEQP